MARRQARPRPEQERTLVGTRRECPACDKPMRIRYENRRTVVTLNGPVRLRLKIRRCESPACAQRHRVGGGGGGVRGGRPPPWGGGWGGVGAGWGGRKKRLGAFWGGTGGGSRA